MRIKHFLAAMALVGSLGFSVASAQDESKPERPRRGQNAEGTQRPERGAGAQGGPGGQGLAQMLKRLPIMVALDTDSDGVLSTEEINGAVAALKKLDKNGDGKITMEEMVPVGMAREGAAARPGAEGRGAMGPEMMQQMFANRDKDGDGKLSGDEIPEMLAGRIERIDSDGDGAISKEELTKMAAQMRQREGQGAGGDRPEEGRKRDGSGVKPKRPDAP